MKLNLKLRKINMIAGIAAFILSLFIIGIANSRCTLLYPAQPSTCMPYFGLETILISAIVGIIVFVLASFKGVKKAE